MNRPATLVTAAVAVVLTASLSGCGVLSPSESVASTAPVGYPQPAFRTAPCNLGEYWDSTAKVKRAEFAAPTVDTDELELYGPMIANDTCSDAEILKWQELRRELGEADEICRVVWYDDYFSAVTYDIGCAVPVVVTDASR
ncbi:hypothetical protein [Microbacterium sp. NPDC064584]|uniref:hypothetical protein n=1 Tax=Microbacterium sp. NPDC064584 TaxID=3155817 RepID=UPI0034457953